MGNTTGYKTYLEGCTIAFLHLKDATIYYEIKGVGYPLIFIHGMGLSHINWGSQVDYLSKEGFQTITLDTRGHGRSTETKDPYKKQNIIKQTTQDVYTLLKKLGLEKGIFIGYSTGTVAVQDFALTYPEMTEGLILTGAFPKISNTYLFGKFTGSMSLAFLKVRKPLEKGVARSNGKDEEQIQLFQNEAQKARRKETVRLLKDSLFFDCRKQLKHIHVPILVTYGGNERHMMTYRQQYLTLAPTAEVCLFPHVNHATPTKSTPLYNKVLLDFAKKVAKEGNYVLKT